MPDLMTGFVLPKGFVYGTACPTFLQEHSPQSNSPEGTPRQTWGAPSPVANMSSTVSSFSKRRKDYELLPSFPGKDRESEKGGTEAGEG